MKLLKVITLALAGIMLLSTQCLAKSPEEGYQSFSVAFEQDGQNIKPNGHIINLQKKGFAIIISFLGYQGGPVAVRLNTNINGNYYKIASNGIQVADLLADGIGMAEPVNPPKNLILTDNKASQYLLVDGSRSRFHEVKAAGNTIMGKRYVNEINFRGGGSYPIRYLTVNELYMVFSKRTGTGVQQEYYLIRFPAT